MAKFLSDLLRAEEPLFTHDVQALEKATGRKGVDVRLIADMTHRAHDMMRELGLEPAITTGQEFYRALLARARRDNERLATLMGGKDPSDARHMAPLVLQAAATLLKKQAWVIKVSSAEKLLHRMPPKKLLKHLGCKDVAQLLEKQDIYEAYVALRFSEGDEWLVAFNQSLDQLTPDDFERRDIQLRQLDHDMYAALAEPYVAMRQHNVVHSKEFGVVAIAPMQDEFKYGITLTMLLMSLHYINEVTTFSSFIKLNASKKNFGDILVATLNNETPMMITSPGEQQIHWRAVQRYFGTQETAKHPEEWRPHIHPEELRWQSTEALLSTIDPAMRFWHDCHYVGLLFDGAPVSANLVDVAASLSAVNSYEERQFEHFRESLWNEIFMRYMGDESVRRQVLLHI